MWEEEEHSRALVRFATSVRNTDGAGLIAKTQGVKEHKLKVHAYYFLI